MKMCLFDKIDKIEDVTIVDLFKQLFQWRNSEEL